jgi:hypothetical protein
MGRHLRILGAEVLLVVACSLLVSGLQAQTFTATLNGRVADPSGGVIVGAKVTIRNVATNLERAVTTGTEGNFVLALLPSGEYTVTVEAEGFKKDVRSGIILQVGQQARLDITLALGSRAEVVQVHEDVPIIQSENASVGGVVDERKIAELPLDLRNFMSLAQLQPNVFLPAQGSTLGFRGGFNVAGNSEIANNFLLDGIDNLDETTNQPNHTPVLDAVREFRVLTGTYSAEYGRQAGGQVIVSTKSGTNEFHGTAFEFLRNDDLDARNFFTQKKPELKRHQFGGTFGGPVRRDKAFFFVSYGGLRSGAQSAAVATVPTLKMHNGDFSELLPNGECGGAGQPSCLRNPLTGKVYNNPPNVILRNDWDPAGKGLLDLYPTANLIPGLLAQNLPVSAVERSNLDQFSVRLDYRFGEETSLFASYNFADSSSTFPIGNPLCGSRVIPGYGCDEPQRTQLLALVLTHSFSPHVLLEARVGYNRFGFFRLQEDRTADVVKRLRILGLPDVGVTPFNNGAPATLVSGMSTLGGPTNLPQGRHDNTYHYVANLTYIRGKHTFKAGADIRRFLFNSFFTSFGRGELRFNGGFTGNPVADLLLGLPSRARRNPGRPFHNALEFSSGFYFQDDWKLRPSFTFNWGIRYELDFPPIEKVNKFASFDPTTNTIKVAGGLEALPIIDTSVPGFFLRTRPRPDVGRQMWNTDKNNWAPRLGFAWKPWGSQSWVIRAGYGVYYNLQIVGNGITPLNRGLPFRLRQTFDNNAATCPSTCTVSSIFLASGKGTLSPPGIDQNFRTAYIQEWSLGVQRELLKDLALDVSYLGSKGTKLPAEINLGQALQPFGPRPFSGWSDIFFRVSGAASSFHSMQVRVEKRLSQGFSLLSSYTFSKSLDNAPGISTGSDAFPSDTPQNSYNLPGERGRSDFDITHRYVLSSTYELPVGRGRRFLRDAPGVVDAILGGWELSGILTLQSGEPFTVLLSDSIDQSATLGFSDRPNRVGDPFQPGPVAANPRCKDPLFVPPTRVLDPSSWFNPCAFLVPPMGQFGNSGRNTLVGPTLRNFDFGLFKNWRIRERVGLQFRAEFFNLANHPNFGLPNNVIGKFDSKGLITDPRVGKIGTAADKNTTGSQRQIQFGFKLSF